jgi:hypothetical protein
MMMAHDPGQTPRSRLDDESIDAVRVALRAYLNDSEDPRLLSPALVALATQARERAILPEQLLVVLKDVWGGLPEVRSMTDSREQIRLLQQVVTLCIKEYYGA